MTPVQGVGQEAVPRILREVRKAVAPVVVRKGSRTPWEAVQMAEKSLQSYLAAVQ
jgi:hypothetical protein